MNNDIFSLKGRVAAVIGGAGVLGSAIAAAFGRAGARVAIADLKGAPEAAAKLAAAGIEAKGYAANAMEKPSVEAARDAIIRDFGSVNILLNAVGGNMPDATTGPEKPIWNMPIPALEKVVGLNLFGGAIVPSQVFCQAMAANPAGGSVINIASMNAIRPLTRIPGYSAAKAAVANWTMWFAVHIAKEYNPKLRVNAIAPGFFLTEQNRFLLTERQGGGWTERGKTILAHTPMGRLGEPDDLAGAVIWLASDASAFVTGTVIPIDGGFSAFSGV
ncbi:MAG: SDR family oxidoreductase [Candidatus Coatesbacteria bacterium]